MPRAERLAGVALPRAVVTVVACLFFLQSAGRGESIQTATPVIDADGANPVLVGMFEQRAAVPAERVELLLAIEAQRSSEANRASTGALLALVRATLPGVRATAKPTTELSGRHWRMGGPYGGFVRADLTPPTGDAALRRAVNRLVAAILRLDKRHPAASANIVSIASGYASCAPFATRGAAAAGDRIERYARALGEPVQKPALQDRIVRTVVSGGPQYPDPLCGPDAHATHPTMIELPPTTSFAMVREYGFAQRMRFAAPSITAERETVPAVWNNDTFGARVLVRARTPVITLEGHAVAERRRSDGCLVEPEAVRRALDDAASRATRVGALLGTSVDSAHPIAVALEQRLSAGNCDYRTALPEPTSSAGRHVGGALRTTPVAQRDTDDVYVTATFPIADTSLSGSVEAEPAGDPDTSYTARAGFVPPPFDYLDAALAGEARREVRLRPDRARIELELFPDRAHGFRAIDPALVPLFANRLGARDEEYTAEFFPSAMTRPSGAPEPDRLEVVAVLPYRGEQTQRAANDAVHSLDSAGQVVFSVLQQRDVCASAADNLARDTIRAAAAQAHPAPGARLVAIDLRGPFAADGVCRTEPNRAVDFFAHDVKLADVRLTAYARVSYAR